MGDIFDDEREELSELQEFEIWLENGIERGWVSEPFCSLHEDSPSIVTEKDDWDLESESCEIILKVIKY